MRSSKSINRAGIAALAATALLAVPAAALAGAPGGKPAKPQARHGASNPGVRARVGMLPVGTQRPTTEVKLSVGQGELITLPTGVASVWTSNPEVADVYVANPRQIHLFGKAGGEATVFATTTSGAVVYSTNVRVGQNLNSIDAMLKTAMPDSDIKVTTVGQLAVLTGTVASPDDVEQAQRLVTALLNPGVNTSDANTPLKIGVFNRLKTATPLQVNLQVRIAEVNRNFTKNIGVNFTSSDAGGGFLYGIGQGRQGSIVRNGNSITYTPPAPITGGTTLSRMGRMLGMDLLASLDLGEQTGQVVTLATPNITALSGETGTFLAGGEIPIPVSQGNNSISVEYKQYGVSLSFTPTVLADGRISMRVRPEVSQLTSSGAVTLNGISIPALTTRRSETTVELGSGESFVIGGLLQNTHNNGLTRAPGLGDLPILGALFRSNAWQRNETELMIVITPYLVKPVNANQIALPTDGYRAPNDAERILFGQLGSGMTGADRPKPRMAPSGDARPAMGAAAPAPVDAAPAPVPQPVPAARRPRKSADAAPGFGF